MSIFLSKNFKDLLKFIIPYNLVVLWSQRTKTRQEAENCELKKKELFAIGWLKEQQQTSSMRYQESIEYSNRLAQ